MSAYYNEIDPFAAAWLRELIRDGHIAPGEVDERDIRDVVPAELAGFDQCHFFAGIGVWSYALRRAGWPDDQPVWTGSCPCQPFSAAGKGAGFDDERHLWPAWQWIIRQCGPEFILGEQVASGDANLWLDLVQADVEAMGYAFGCVPFPAAGIGSPNIRDRAFWMADAVNNGRGQLGYSVDSAARTSEELAWEWERLRTDLADGGTTSWLGNAELSQGPRIGEHGGQVVSVQEAKGSGLSGLAAGGRGHADDAGLPIGPRPDVGRGIVRDQGSPIIAPGPVNGFWSAAEWIWCSDDRWRPVESGTTALANGVANRVGQLRGYGNAINAEVATAFIKAVMAA